MCGELSYAGLGGRGQGLQSSELRCLETEQGLLWQRQPTSSQLPVSSLTGPSICFRVSNHSEHNMGCGFGLWSSMYSADRWQSARLLAMETKGKKM